MFFFKHAQESLIVTALRESEDTHIDQTLLEEQLVSTDWEATQEELIKQITRDSYREWLCERDPQVKENRTVSDQKSNKKKDVDNDVCL